jgi:hypothetical protein
MAADKLNGQTSSPQFAALRSRAGHALVEVVISRKLQAAPGLSAGGSLRSWPHCRPFPLFLCRVVGDARREHVATPA